VDRFFKFADYALCYYTASNGHINVGGAASGNHTIVSALTSNAVQRATTHEMSHTVGAKDPTASAPCTSGQPCVMDGVSGSSINAQWCTKCQNDIKTFLK